MKNELGLTRELGKEGIADRYVKDVIKVDVAATLKWIMKFELTPGAISNKGEVTNPETMKLSMLKCACVL